MSGPVEMHEKAWATRGSVPFVEEADERPVKEEGPRRFRPTMGTPLKPDDSRTEALVRGESLVFDVALDSAWEPGERLQIENVRRRPVCVALVVEAFLGQYVIRGESRGRLDD